MVAIHSLADLRRVLNPNGRCVVVGFSTLAKMIKVTLLGPWLSRTGDKEVGMLMPEENEMDLVYMKELIEAGEVSPIIDRSYSLEQVPEAIGYLEKGHAQGKVVITVKHHG
jgi:NADPH:quinone reductase-like Zn-dependent oxidoreductase